MLERLSVATLALVSALSVADAARALPLVIHSESGDGSPSDVVRLSSGGETKDLDLWLLAEETFIGFSVSLGGDPGVALVSFSPDPAADPAAELRFNLVSGDGGSLSLIAGGGFLTMGPRFRLGALRVAGHSSGARVSLRAVPGADRPALVDADFDLIEFELPQLLAIVPEADLLLLMLAACAGVSFRRRAGIARG